VRITSRGNLVGLESPFGFEHIANGRGTREGYVVAYDDPATGGLRVLHDVNDSWSRTLGSRDLVPYSFRGPATGTTFPINALVTATVVVDTADGVLRLTHQFEWRAGYGRVKVTTTVANRLAGYISLRSFKRVADMDVDAAAMNDWERSDNGVSIYIFCLCSPPIPPSPIVPGTHVMSFTGAPAPGWKLIKPAGDVSEFSSAGPVMSSDLAGLRRNENNQATLIWAGNRLGLGGTQSFTAEYQVE
jgi:hypothetical protein